MQGARRGADVSGWLLATLMGIAAPVAAQTATATLIVEVRDGSGAVVPGAAVTLTHEANGIIRRATTSSGGTAVVVLLSAGSYTVRAALDGFRETVVGHLPIAPGAKRTLDLVLEPGPVAERVMVEADDASVRSGTGAVGTVFGGPLLVMTPVASREIADHAALAPGAVTPAPGSRLSTQGSTGVNVSGAREAANNFLLDGVDNNDRFLNRIVVSPSLDAVQEFTLVGQTYDAEYGRNAGGQVNVVLKSGGERLQGSAYDYVRTSALSARGPLDPPDSDPYQQRHQFGGTIGGRLRGRHFFFASAEALADRGTETRVGRVPPAAERAGDFSQSAVWPRDPVTGQPFPGGIIPASRIDRTGAEMAALFPMPTRDDPTGNFVGSPTGARDGLAFTVKTDHHRWPSLPVTLRYSLSRDERDQPYPARGRNLPGFGLSVEDEGQHVAAGVSRTFSPTVLGEFRAGWNRLARDVGAANQGLDGFAALGMRGPDLAADDQGLPAIITSGLETVGDDPNVPVSRRARTWHVAGTVSVDRGRHLVKTGGDVRHYASDGFNHVFTRGQLNFRGAMTGHAFADLLLGLPSATLLATNDNPQALRTTAVGLFLQDDWRATDRLTVNLGVRYEFSSPPVDAADRMRVLDLSTFDLVPVGQGGVPRSGVASDRNNVAPRLGASWNVTGDARVVVRGGFGLYYDSGTLIENSALYFNPPFFTLRVYTPGRAPLLASDPFPSGGGFVPPPAANTLSPAFPAAEVRQSSLGVEWRIRGTDVAARYVGNRGRQLVAKRNINQPAPAPGPVALRRPEPQYGDILFIAPGASSAYDSLQLSAERRRASGLSLRVAYTWSKSIDDQSAFLASDGNDNTPQNSRRPDLEWGLSDFDARHRLTAGVVWMLPALGTGALGRGWQMSTLLTAMSGRPFTPRVSFDNSNTGNLGGQFGYDRPDEVSPGRAGAVGYDGRWFAVAPPYSFGNAGRNILTGPSYGTLDAAVAKTMELGRRVRLDLRLEVYNALNRDNLGLPDSFVDRPTFGQSLSALPPRQMQVVARLLF